MTYAEKLKDPRWQKKRLKILERDDFHCIRCLDSETTLHVHHLKYSGQPWEVEDKYLQTLCEYCHNSETHERPVLEKQLLKVMRESGVSIITMESLIKSIANSNNSDMMIFDFAYENRPKNVKR